MCFGWLPGYLATWLLGYLATWLPGYLATRLPPKVAPKYDNISMCFGWLPGYLATWLPGYPPKSPRNMIISLCVSAGYLATWLPGSQLLGYLATRQILWTFDLIFGDVFEASFLGPNSIAEITEYIVHSAISLARFCPFLEVSTKTRQESPNPSLTCPNTAPECLVSGIHF